MSVEAMKKRLPTMRFEWLPEAVDPAEFSFEKPLAERRLDVLELGRRSPHYHAAIRNALRKEQRTHVFEQDGTLLFPLPKRAAMLETYADSKITICFPCSITHPARSGTTETATARYFEAMASKALIVGHCPAELKDLFGYDPVISVNWDNPARQLCNELLPRIANYQDLVERNYQKLLQVGTFRLRARRIIEVLSHLESPAAAT
jgi:hypothetical protein